MDQAGRCCASSVTCAGDAFGRGKRRDAVVLITD